MNINITPKTISFQFGNDNEKAWIMAMLEISKSVFSNATNLAEVEENLMDKTVIQKVLNGTIFEDKGNEFIGKSEEILPIFLIVEVVLENVPEEASHLENARQESLRLIRDIISELKNELKKV